tara:strand:- start:405 stop:3011 length:2607 start_codon:yes stop_codon:yes gene_type:complete
MATPVWTTTAGTIASINEQASFSLQLEANTTDSTAITYSLIAGSLPSGMSLTSDGLLTGTPAEVAKRTLYTFVVRATAGSAITDRSFAIDVSGADAPSFTTVAGQLNKPLSTVYTTDSSSTTDSTLSTADVTGNVTVLDGSFIEYSIVATDTDTEAGQNLVYEVVSGSLPPGVTMTTGGKISGIVQLAIDESYGPQGGYDFDKFPDYSALNPDEGGSPTNVQNIYDRTVFSKSRSVNYDFIVRVTDGVSSTDRNFNIFVYSADYWIVSNSNVTIDQTLVGANFVTMDLHTGRPPVFTTESDLGTFRHDNAVVIKIEVSDFDPLQANLEYSITAGALPPGLEIDLNSGEIFGTLSTQSAIEVDYTFTVRANRVVATGLNTFSERTFTMKVIGEIDIGIRFTTPAIIGTLTADIPSTLSIVAETDEPNRVLSYSVTAGSLPTGITLSDQGNLIGTIDSDNFTDSTRSFSFTVTVSDQYQSQATSQEFTLNISIPFTTIQYGNMTGDATSFIDQNLFYNIAQDTDINSPEYIYRPEDSNFGMKLKPNMLMMAGLEAQTLTEFQQQMEQNHAPKTLYFGDLKTAVAKENNVIKYEVVYIDIKDNLTNDKGETVSSSVTLRDAVAKPVIGPRASSTNATTDYMTYEVTTDGGLSFSTSGSKVRYANQLSADLGFIEIVYPNAVANMRSRMKSLGHKEWTYLPEWMRTTQEGDLAPLGYVKAVPICYCKPGTSALIKKRIQDKNIEFKNIEFIIDKYSVSKSLVSPETFTGDGSTTTFELNEIVHEQDILVKEGSEVVFVGSGVTADNNIKPTYLTADGTLRSADHEFGITLTHNTTTKKTTITFTKEVPSAGTIIKVDRSNDKYLKFRDKGIF